MAAPQDLRYTKTHEWVRQDGETCSLVVTVQGRAHGTEAYLTLEAMERAASLPTDRVLARLLDALTRPA